MSEQTEAYVSDAPILDPENDRFRRWPFAKRIAETVAARGDPSSIVIAIYGGWGEGKTTVLNFIESALSKTPNTVCVRYNPWRFGGEDQMLGSFFRTLGATLGRSLSTPGQKIASALEQYSDVLALAGKSGEALGKLAKRMAKTDLGELKDHIDGILRDQDKRIVVLIDDIDRLDRSEVFAVFRLVKLSAGFPNVAYILAFDKAIVAASLGERFAEGDVAAGGSFLEKIIQVPLDLPGVDSASMRKLTFHCLNEALRGSGMELTEQQIREFGQSYTNGLEPLLRTPRMCKRYGNALSFALPILKDEVNPVDLMLIEGIRVLRPELYTLLRNNKEALLPSYAGFRGLGDDRGDDERLASFVESTLRGVDEETWTGMHQVLCALFPGVGHVFGGSEHGPDCHEEWYKQKRVCSQEYFDRYFRYAIPEGDIPDHVVDTLLVAAELSPDHVIATRLMDLAEKYGGEPLISKLRASEKRLSEKTSITLAKAVSRCATAFPRPDILFSFGAPFSQAAIYVSQLLRNVANRSERMVITLVLVTQADSLPFAAELYRWIPQSMGGKGSDENIVDPEDVDLGTGLATRIRAESEKVDLLAEYPRDIPSLLGVWRTYGSQAECSTYVENLLEREPRRVTSLLLSFVPAAWRGSEKVRGRFLPETYHSIADILNPDLIEAALQKTYGRPLSELRGESVDDGEWVAHMFEQLHVAAKLGPESQNGGE